MGDILGLIVIILVIGLIILIAFKSKSLLKMQLLQGSFFKQIKFLFSSPESAQKNFLLSETGNASMPLLPMKTGHESSDLTNRTWSVLHPLKYQLYQNGKPLGDESVLILSERDHIPLDPNNRLTPQAKEKLASLNDIAKLTFFAALSDATKQKTMQELSEVLLYGSLIISALSLVVYLFRGKAG